MYNKRVRLISFFVIMLWLFSLNVVQALADDVDVRASLSLSGDDEYAVAQSAVWAVDSNNILTVSNMGNSTVFCLFFDGKEYSELSGDEKRDFMEKVLATVAKSGASARAKNKVYNFIASQDTAVTNALKYLQSDANADFASARKYFDPWSSVVGSILGVLCVLIFMCSSISVLFDVGYLVLPGVQAILERGDDNSKPFGVSREAYSALRDAEKSDEYRNVLAIYLKRRVGLIVTMALCLSYVISGKMYDIVIFFIDAF